jgi:hypothetical protein
MNIATFNEILDRYLGNAASEEEVTRLFDAMSANPELNQEFNAALEVERYFASEASSVELPPSMYREIVTQAQLTGVPLSVASNVGSTLFGLSHFTYGIALSLFTISLATYLSLNNSTSSKSHVVSAKEPVAGYTEFVAPTTKSLDNFTGKTSLVRRVQDQLSDLGYSNTVSLITVSPTLSNPILFTHDVEEQDNSSEMIETSGPLYTANAESMFSINASMSPLVSYSYTSQQPPVSSVGIQLNWHPSPSHQLGVGYRSDALPMLSLKDGVAVPVNQLEWAYVSWRYQPDVQLPLDVTPFFSVSLGGSDKGLAAAPLAGLTYTFSNVSVSVGAELLAFAAQSQTTWQMRARSGLRCELGYKW